MFVCPLLLLPLLSTRDSILSWISGYVVVMLLVTRMYIAFGKCHYVPQFRSSVYFEMYSCSLFTTIIFLLRDFPSSSLYSSHTKITTNTIPMWLLAHYSAKGNILKLLDSRIEPFNLSEEEFVHIRNYSCVNWPW